MKLKAIIVKGVDRTYNLHLEYSDKVSFGLFEIRPVITTDTVIEIIVVR